MKMAMILVFCIYVFLAGSIEGQKIPTNAGGRADEPKKIVVKRGDRVVLPCGDMLMTKVGDTVTWIKGGQIITSYRVETLNPTASALILQKVYDVDKGTYKCKIVSQDDPTEEHFVELDILVPPVNVSIRTDNNNNFEAGAPRVLACVVYGCVPSPNVTWFLGDTMLRPNVYKEVNRGNFTVSSLTFVPSLIDDGKDLVCKVTNHNIAEAFEDRITVSVGHRPICIDSDFKSIGAITGDSETLVCVVESNPEPEQFIWTFADGRTIYTSSKQKVSGHGTWYSSTLVWVPREDDFGPLYCRASNRFGEQKQPCTFSVINGGPPTSPNCELCWEDHETLKVQCDKNWDGGRPQTIHLEVKGPEGTRKVSRKGHELRVKSLHPNVNFSVELFATNSRGKSAVVQLVAPEPPAAEPVAPIFEQSLWAYILQCTLVSFLGGLFMLCLVSYLYCTYKERCCNANITNSDEDDETFRRDVQLLNIIHNNDDIPSNFPAHAAVVRDVNMPACLNLREDGYVQQPPYHSNCMVPAKENRDIKISIQHYV